VSFSQSHNKANILAKSWKTKISLIFIALSLSAILSV